MGLFGATSVALIAGGAPRAAALEGKPEAIRLRFEVEERLIRQCPDRARFVELLLAERPRLSLATEDAASRTFEVRIRSAPGGGFVGEVGVVEADGGANTRRMRARECQTLVRALAVVAAVASDFVAESTELPAGDAPSPSEPAAVASDVSEAPASGAARRLTPPRMETAEPPSHEPAPLAMGVGAATELVLGTLPRPTMGYRAYVDAQRSLGAFDGAIRSSVAFARAQLPGTSRLNVFVQTWTARVEGCAGRRLAGAVSAEGCLGATAGAFHSFSAGVAGARDDVRPWLSVGPAFRARWHLPAAIHAEIYANPSYVVTAYDTVARDHTGASHVVPRIVGEIGLGLGHSFTGP